MRNKLRVIDVSMLSTYMGKALTGVVTLFVVGVALSALFYGGGVEKNVLRVCVAGGPRAGEALVIYEPFRSLLSRETRRPVVLVEGVGEWPLGFDLYVMPVDAYFREERRLGVAALYETRTSENRADKAVVIARQAEAGADLSRAAPDEIVFSHPRSVNGFWVQADALSRSGFALPAQSDRLRFEGSERDATGVIYGVIFGAYDYGACKLSEMRSLADQGMIDARSLRVIRSDDALPEVVLAADRGEADYLDRRIGAVARLLDEDAPLASQDDTVELLKARGVGGIDKLDRERLGAVRTLFDRFGAFQAGAPRQ